MRLMKLLRAHSVPTGPSDVHGPPVPVPFIADMVVEDVGLVAMDITLE
jgi:hypothetical protein